MKYPEMAAAMLMTPAIGLPVDVAAQKQVEMITAFGELRRGEIEVRGGMRRSAFRVGDTVAVRGWVDDDLIDIPRENYVNRFWLVACKVKRCHTGPPRNRDGVRNRDDYGLLV